MNLGISSSMMSALSTNNSDSTNLVVPKLHNDGSNWANYEPHIQRALGLKELYFQLMSQWHDNLLKMGLTISNLHYNTIIMSSLPELYWLTLQTMTAKEHTSTLLGTSSSRTMIPDDLITFIMEEAQHQVINNGHTKNAESTLVALGKKQKAGKQWSNKGKEKSTSGESCKNCKSSGHIKANCWLKGGGKEGQGPRGWNSKKGEKKVETAVAAEVTGNADKIFMFTCMSDYVGVTNALNIPKSWLSACIDSGVIWHYSPDHDAFINYCLISNTTISQPTVATSKCS